MGHSENWNYERSEESEHCVFLVGGSSLMSEKDLNVDRACCPLISGRTTVMAALGAGVVTALDRPGWCKHDRQMAV